MYNLYGWPIDLTVYVVTATATMWISDKSDIQSIPTYDQLKLTSAPSNVYFMYQERLVVYLK